MSIPLSVNGAVFNYPVNFDTNWGIDATGWAQAVTAGMLQKAGGSFPLTADVNFGPTFGLISPYYKSTTANVAAAGIIRLAKTDTLSWRNNANSADLPLGINGSDNLTFNGSSLSFTGAVNAGTQFQLAYYASTGNAVSGLTLITPNKALQSDANGLPVASGVSTTTLAFLDATSSVQTQINSTVAVANAALPKAGGTMSGNIAMGSNNITGMANGVSAQDAVTVSQLTVAMPSGAMIDFGGTVAPTGWLLCDGSVVAQATYPNLFSAIGSTWNTGGEGGGNFRLPNMNRRVSMGSGGSGTGTIGNVVGSVGGAETHTLTQAELSVALGTASSSVTDPTHAHSMQVMNLTGNKSSVSFVDPNSHGMASTGGVVSDPYTITNVDGQNGRQMIQNSSTGVSVSTTITNASGGNAHTIVQPAAIVLKIIKI